MEVSETDETTIVCMEIEPKDYGENPSEEDFFSLWQIVKKTAQKSQVLILIGIKHLNCQIF